MNLEKVYEILEKQAELIGYSFEDKENGDSAAQLSLSDWYIENHKLTEQDKNRVVHVETEGGEDCGSYYHIILKVRDDESGEEVYVRWVGHYDSWNGTDWYNDPEIVTPINKVVTVAEWQSVK